MRHKAGYLAIAITLTLVTSSTSSLAGSDKVTGSAAASRAVDVRDVTVENNTVTGLLVNTSTQALRDVRLVIRNAWLWKDERNPGSNNPSYAEPYSFPGEVAIGASVPFSYRLKSAAHSRTDGKFMTSVEVVSYSLVKR